MSTDLLRWWPILVIYKWEEQPYRARGKPTVAKVLLLLVCFCLGFALLGVKPRTLSYARQDPGHSTIIMSLWHCGFPPTHQDRQNRCCFNYVIDLALRIQRETSQKFPEFVLIFSKLQRKDKVIIGKTFCFVDSFPNTSINRIDKKP